MNVLPPPGKGQVLALCLVFIAGTIVYFLGFAWYFKGLSEVRGQISEDLSMEQEARAKIAQQPVLQKRLADISAFEQSNTYFLPEETFDLAAAGLNTKIKDVLGSPDIDASRCSVISSQNQRLPTEDPYERVTIEVRLRCDLEPFSKLMYALENSTPLLFVNELNLYQQPVFDAGIALTQLGTLDVRFQLSGFIRKKVVPAT
jgi:general secretion pathway protein M